MDWYCNYIVGETMAAERRKETWEMMTQLLKRPQQLQHADTLQWHVSCVDACNKGMTEHTAEHWPVAGAEGCSDETFLENFSGFDLALAFNKKLSFTRLPAVRTTTGELSTTAWLPSLGLCIVNMRNSRLPYVTMARIHWFPARN